MSPSTFRLRTTSLNALRLRRIFGVFDLNHDGVITLEELGQALQQLGLEAGHGELETTVAAYIKQAVGGLEYEDFEELHRTRGDALFEWEEEEGGLEQDEEDLSEAFKVFDEDGEAFISAAELKAVLGKLGYPEGREIEEVRRMICSVDLMDLNRDGRVDFIEFKHMMQGMTVRTA